MKDFILSCESTVDLEYSHLINNNVSIIFYSYLMNEEVFVDDMGRDSTHLLQFYKKIEEGASPTTTLINESLYEQYFEGLIEKGDILHISFSSGLTSSLKNAYAAADEVMSNHPGSRIVIVDSLCASSGYGMLVDYAIDLKNRGNSLDEIKDWLEENKLRIHHEFFATDLTHFKRGGRVKASSAFIAGILGICPLMTLNNEGKIILQGKSIGKKKAMQDTILKMKNMNSLGFDYSSKCYISHSNCLDVALSFKKKVEEAFPNLKDKIEVHDIGTIIGCHTGTGTVALYFLGDKR